MLRLRASAPEAARSGTGAGAARRRLSPRGAESRRRGRRQPATPIPWTFCTVEEVAEEELRGRLETGLRDPLAERWETRMEVLALGVVPPRQAERA